MSAANYNKEDAVEFGRNFGRLVNGVRDGIDMEDLNKLIATITSGAEAINEAKDVPGAFGTHAISGATEMIGDKLLEDALAAETDVDPT